MPHHVPSAHQRDHIFQKAHAVGKISDAHGLECALDVTS